MCGEYQILRKNNDFCGMEISPLYQSLNEKPFLIAGPCVIESQDLILTVAERAKAIAEKHGFTYIFKASFDKANRTSIDAFRGPGLERGLAMLERVKREIGVPVTTDIHEASQAAPAAEVVDIIQLPAFLCRQTDLLVAAGNTGKIVNVKKAQFLSAHDMRHVVGKLESTGNRELLLCERGSMMGFNNLVVDYTGVLEMQKYGYPVVMDATHSVQKPGGLGGKSGGNREYVPFVAQAAAAVGVRGFFMEIHPDPEQALSDGPNSVYLDKLDGVLERLKRVIEAVA